MVGIYQTTADKMYFNYVRPQENGHHTDTRWLNLSPDKGNGLVIVADSLIGFNALRNSVEDFDSEEALPHPYQWNNFSPEEAANHDEKAARNVLRPDASRQRRHSKRLRRSLCRHEATGSRRL